MEIVSRRTDRATPRGGVLQRIADAILALPSGHVRRIGVDGVDGAGKTVFADELAATLEAAGTAVIRASGDGFHHPRQVRYRRGRDSPEGFFLDSFDLAQLRDRLLDPLGPGGNGRYVRAIRDVASDTPTNSDVEVARDGQVLVLDGLFLHRPELVDAWEAVELHLRLLREDDHQGDDDTARPAGEFIDIKVEAGGQKHHLHRHAGNALPAVLAEQRQVALREDAAFLNPSFTENELARLLHGGFVGGATREL
jgi:hypothetical protein